MKSESHLGKILLGGLVGYGKVSGFFFPLGEMGSQWRDLMRTF